MIDDTENEENPLMEEPGETDEPGEPVSLLYDTDGEPRNQGVFTKDDRQYLIGEKEYSLRQGRYRRRKNMADRVTNTFTDFQLLHLLDSVTVNKIFGDAGRPWIHQTLRDLIAFYYVNAVENEPDTLIEDAVEAAIHQAESSRDDRRSGFISVDLTIEKGPDIETARRLLDQGRQQDLTLQQIGALVREGEIETSELEDLAGPTNPPTPESLMDNG